jgi:nucleoside-diphosphate-sugar epimerase
MILIIGGRGFIGYHTVRRLSGAGPICSRGFRGLPRPAEPPVGGEKLSAVSRGAGRSAATRFSGMRP